MQDSELLLSSSTTGFNGLLEVCGWLKGHSGVSWLSGIMAVFWLYDQGAKDLSQGIIPSVVNEVSIIGEVLVLIWLDFICIVYNFYNIFTNHTFNTSSRSSCDELSFRSSDLHRFFQRMPSFCKRFWCWWYLSAISWNGTYYIFLGTLIVVAVNWYDTRKSYWTGTVTLSVVNDNYNGNRMTYDVEEKLLYYYKSKRLNFQAISIFYSKVYDEISIFAKNKLHRNIPNN